MASHFAILSIEYATTATGIKIITTTNTPCHAFCYRTAEEPQKHLIPILSRGVELHTQLQYCFVAWHENEQEEAGDTTEHTFIIEPWPVCETRWLTFRAKIAGLWAASVSPIFKRHRTQPTEPTMVTFHANHNTGYYYKLGTTWAIAWAAATGSVVQPPCTLEVTAREPYKGLWTISRAGLFFNTSTLPPDCSIMSANLKVAFYRDVYYPNPGEFCFTTAIGMSDTGAPSDYGVLRSNVDQICSSITIPSLVFHTYYTLSLNPTGIAQISKTGLTKYGIRAKRDINNLEPSTSTRLWIGALGHLWLPTYPEDALLEVYYL